MGKSTTRIRATLKKAWIVVSSPRFLFFGIPNRLGFPELKQWLGRSVLSLEFYSRFNWFGYLPENRTIKLCIVPLTILTNQV